VLENMDGSGDLLSMKCLKRMFKFFNSKIEYVFFSACYSETHAQAFLNAGVSHVICINKDNTIMDESCIIFSKAFYQSFFTHHKNCCEAFIIAQQTICLTKGVET